MDCDGMRSSSRRRKATFSAMPIKVVVKQKSFDDLTQAASSSNSIRRRKTDFDVQSMNWTTTSAKDFVTSYLRLKVKHQRVKHLRTSSMLSGGDAMSPSLTLSGSFIRSSLSELPEQVYQRRSSKEVFI